MRFHLRFPEDDWVDRPELEAQQCVEATGTNTPNKPTPGFSTNHTQNKTLFASTMQSLTQHTQCHNDISILIITITSTPIDVSVVDSGGETPGPIPNPEAKPARADGTAPGREWESRLPPTQQLHTQTPVDETTQFHLRVFFTFPSLYISLVTTNLSAMRSRNVCNAESTTKPASLCHCIVNGWVPNRP